MGSPRGSPYEESRGARPQQKRGGSPQGYGVSKLSPETIAVTLSGRNRDFTLLDPEALRVVIRLPGGVTGLQRLRIQESMISHPSALSVVNFTPRYLEFTIQKQE